MTTISGSSLQPTHTVQVSSNQTTAQSIQQGHADQRVGRVQSLASEGRELPLPDAVTQHTTDADGEAVGKHKKKSRTLKNLFGMKGKHKAASPSHPNPGQRQSPGKGTHLNGADANLPADTVPRGERDGNATRSRPMTSRLMHQLGLKQRKAEQGATQETQRPAASTPLPGGFGSHSLEVSTHLNPMRRRESSAFVQQHLEVAPWRNESAPGRVEHTPTRLETIPEGDESEVDGSGSDTSLQEEDPEVSAHLEALRRRGASAFAPPRLETIPEGDEDEEDDAEDASFSVGRQSLDKPPADKLRAGRGKEPLFSPPHTTFEIGESSGGSSSTSEALPEAADSLAKDHPEVSAHLKAMRRRGASAFIQKHLELAPWRNESAPGRVEHTPTRLETIPEIDEDDAEDASFSVGRQSLDEPSADKLRAGRGKEPLFNPPHTTFEIGESSGASRPPLDTPSSPDGGSSSSSEVDGSDSDPSLQEEDPEVSAHLEALRRRGASAFAPPRLETIPEIDEDDAEDASFSVGRQSLDEPSADKLRAGRGKEPLFSPPHTTLEIGESSGASRPPLDTPSSPDGGSSSSSEVDGSDSDTSLQEEDPEVSAHLEALRRRGASAFAPPRLETIPEGDEDAADSLQPPRLGVANGKLTIAPETPAPVATMLKETLGKASQSYVAHESLQDDRQQYLLDRTGRVFQVSTDPGAGLVAMHSSTAMLDAEQPPASLFGHLSESGLPTGDPNYLALATGIHRDGNGDHWRVHDDKLHKLSSERQWHPDRPDINKLAPGRDGGLYGLQSSTQIIDLATGRGSETTPHPIAAFTIDRQGEVAQVLKPDNGGNNYLRLLPSLEASPEQALEVTPRYAPGTPIPGLKSSDAPELTSIAFSERALFAIDKENRVLMAPLPQQGQTEVNFQVLPQEGLQNALGNDIQFEGFTHHGDGELSILSKDHSGQGQLHVGPLDASGKAFRPGWNVSDILHIGNTRGLEPEAPQNLRLQDFGKHGQLGLADGKLYAKDKLTQQWTQVDEKIVGLQRGLDGQPYALQDGKLKKVGVKDESSVIGYGDNNVFPLTQTRGKATLGDGPKGMPDGQLKAAAVLSPYQHVTLSDTGELRYTHIRPGTNNDKHPPITIGTQGLEGDIQQLSVDKNERLFALTSEGKLYSLAASDWQKPHFKTPGAAWQLETLPEGTGNLAGASLSNSRDYQAELILTSGERLSRKEQGWEATQASADSERVPTSDSDRLFGNLTLASKDFKIGKGGVKYTATAQLFGFSGQETRIRSSFLDRLSAHVNPRSMLRTPAVAVQHRWQGREGLRPLYEQERELFKKLDDLSNQLKSGQGPERGLAPEHRGMDLKTRLQRLDLGPEGSELKKTLESFRESLELSARNHLIKLGKHQGVLDHGGKLKLDYQTPKLKSSIQALNPNRSDHDLSKELLALWRHCPASPDSDVGQLLKAFRETGVNMSHQATDVPLGRQRDPNDKMALSKSRLALDTLTLLELDQLVKKAEELSGQEASPERLKGLKRDLAELRDDSYENHRAKYYTDHSMSGHHDVEGRYDSAKAFIKAFSNPSHGVNLISRTTLQSKDQQALNRDLKSLLHSLKPIDDVAISRDYSAGISTTFIPEFMAALDIFPTVGVGQKRSYNVEFLGLEDGVEVTLNRNLGPTGNFNIGINKKTLPAMLKREADDVPIAINGGKQTFKPEVKAGAGLTGSAGFVDHNEFTFIIRGKQIDEFVDDLTNGSISPEELVGKGMEHVAMHGRKWNFSLDLGFNFTARARLDVSDEDNNPTVMFRAGGGVSGGINLLSKKKDELHYQGIEKNKHRTNDTTGFLNSASASADMALTFGINKSTNPGDLVMFSNAKSEAQVAVDNSIKVRGEIQTQRAEPVTSESIESLCKSLVDAFHDPISQELVQGVKNLSDIDEQLSILKTHFLSSGTVTQQNDKQYAALRSIKSSSIQHQAASHHGEVMSAAKAVVTHTNTSHLNHGGVLNFLASLISPSRKDALADQIDAMMKADPVFAETVDSIITKPNIHTWVTLELKDEVRHQLEENFLEGKTGLAEVKAALENPQNRRIKSITLYEAGQHKEGFTSPTLLVGASSEAKVYMERVAGTIDFTYGADQDTPRSYTLSGEVVSSKPEVATAMANLKEQGLDIRNQ